MIFDRLTASPNKTDIPDFLSNLIMFLKMVKKKIRTSHQKKNTYTLKNTLEILS